ncbi:major facilitator superfamily domain-containing protein [Ditylenchus destructor]|uniref:Major facilitator superfamily domain-containing protein n=1 Tax=Ditylenchus destructor TaxID=166010 RepID=A0AAD4NL95_9BILA|nr:major facilitator superfamily domain-containing protein [Ditylenchus destructor]
MHFSSTHSIRSIADLSYSQQVTELNSESSSIDSRVPVGWKTQALDGGYGWLVVLGSFTIHVFSDGFVYSFGVIGQALVETYGYSNAEVSAIFSLISGLMYTVGPIAGVICNKFGCRTTAIIGSVLATVGCGLAYFSTRLVHLILTVGVLVGTGFGLLYCPAIVIVTMYFEKKRSLASGITVCGSGVGAVLFSKVIGLLLTHLEKSNTNILFIFPIYGVFTLLCIPCALLFRPLPKVPIYDNSEEDAKTNENAKTATTQKPNSSCWRKIVDTMGLEVLIDPLYILYTASNVFVTMGFNAAPMFLPMNARAVLKTNKDQESNTLTAYGVANTIGRIAFGILGDRKLPFRWGKDTARNRLWTFTLAMILSGIPCCFLFAIDRLWVFLVFTSFFGFVSSSFAIFTSVVLADLLGMKKFTSALGLLFLFQSVVCIIGPLIGGKLYDITHRYDWTFVFLGACFIVGGVMLPFTQLIKNREVATRIETVKYIFEQVII